MIEQVTFGLAFIAGVASFLSPCVLALVPVYVGYLSGHVLGSRDETTRNNRLVTFLHGVAFVLGFSIVFILLGAAASAIGKALFDMRGILTKIGGLVVIVFGLHTMGIITIPILYYDKRRRIQPSQHRVSFFGSACMGVFFSAGWAPCVGPVLGSVLTIALTSESINRGVALLSAYSLGMAIPFLVAALAIGHASNLISRMGKTMRYLEIATGLLLVVIGCLLFSGTLSWLAVSFAQSPSLSNLQLTIDSSIIALWKTIAGESSG